MLSLYAAVRRNGEILQVASRSEIESYVDAFNRRASGALAQVSNTVAIVPVKVRVIRERGRRQREVVKA